MVYGIEETQDSPGHPSPCGLVLTLVPMVEALSGESANQVVAHRSRITAELDQFLRGVAVGAPVESVDARPVREYLVRRSEGVIAPLAVGVGHAWCAAVRPTRGRLVREGRRRGHGGDPTCDRADGSTVFLDRLFLGVYLVAGLVEGARGT